MSAFGTIAFGHFLCLQPGEETHEEVEKYEAAKAHTEYSPLGYTVWYGIELGTIQESDARIENQAMFHISPDDHKQLVKDVESAMMEVPVELRERLPKRPSYFMVWGGD